MRAQLTETTVDIVVYPVAAVVPFDACNAETDGCVRLRRKRATLPDTIYQRFCPYEMIPAVGEGVEACKVEHTGMSVARMKPLCAALPAIITIECAYTQVRKEVKVGTAVKLNNMLLTPNLPRWKGYSAINGFVGLVEHMVHNTAPDTPGQNASNCMRTMFMVRVALEEGCEAKRCVEEANLAVFGGTPADWKCAQSVWVWVSAAQIEVTASPCPFKGLMFPYAVCVMENSEGVAANDFRTRLLAIRSTCHEVPSLAQSSAMMEVCCVLSLVLSYVTV